MNCQFFDAHTHIQFAVFEKDYQKVIKRALEKGVGMINVGTQKDTSLRAVEIAYEFEAEPVYAAVGLHPLHTTYNSHYDIQELGQKTKSFVSEGEEFDYKYYKELALNPKILAIGECGLDYFRITDEKLKKKQKEVFIKQIELAFDVEKPLMIHCRNAFNDLIEILSVMSHKLLTKDAGVIHFFSGTEEDARKLLEMGFSFTFGGVITFSRDYDEIIKMIPLDRILSETDAPYVTPVPYRGKRNEPLYVIEVVKKIAAIKDINLELVQRQILLNTKRIFKIDDILFNY